ncbi:MAG: DUF1460 domain-containing protein [Dysgonamonadaceae bacterium]|jgi:hypothetical protein|nr:DUF1460 domain-containing protein [Dysgonamonadaceae bacterium]MDD3310277.1 DUF1460 domain-containing protein [Dysgonamonadaceae bacterium]MDD3900780.1 DUF1460 domain-containing protein [Dysgonamonadaceae bacterium]MDD4399467.1 DUF1460 domain-containing protein [Dysgonamonadaceae bacterium]MEA5080135.1 DUF1460 domain-containing protein [Dysgonamonadaceae bacterium]
MKTLMTVLFMLIFTFTALLAADEVIYDKQDSVIFEKYKLYIEPFVNTSDETLLDRTAIFFLDTPYVAHTLEVSKEEKLVVNLREFDCTTFVESVLALVCTIKSGGDPTFENFTKHLKSIRYRKGILTDYSSRLHYSSDWVFDNHQKQIVKNISELIGGIKETKTINFMSTHRSSYVQLKNDDVMLEKIRQVEEAINKRGGFWYLPKEYIGKKSDLIPHMALIAFTTSIKGLDVTHIGFAYHKNGELAFIHASSLKDKVVIDNKSLAEYCEGQSICTGVMVIESNIH